MSTAHPDLFRRLAEPFHANDVKVRKQAGRDLHYITARTAMNRLDDVLGPENWWDEFVPQENSVLCRLSIRLPDGRTLTKADAGGYAGMADSGDDDKSGYSDAFKRAAVKFGVARYLYRDGVPDYGPAEPAAEPKPTPPPEPRQKAPGRPAAGRTASDPPFEPGRSQKRPAAAANANGKAGDRRAAWEVVRDGIAAHRKKLVDEYHAPESADALDLNEFQVRRHLVKSRLGKTTEGMNNAEVGQTLEGLWADPLERQPVLDELKAYLKAAYLEARRSYAGETLDDIGQAAEAAGDPGDEGDPDVDYPDEPDAGANG